MAIRLPSEEEIRYLVGEVVSGGHLSIDTVITRAIFGDHKPKTWGEWPKEAVDVWSFGCQYYHEIKTGRYVTRPPPPPQFSLEFSWDLVIGLARDPSEWWSLPGVTWTEIGDRVGLTSRRVSYRMMLLGWRLRGSGMHVPERRVVAAPCVTCGAVWTPREIENRWGPCCARTD